MAYRGKRKIATADCETDPFKYGRIPEPFIWGYYDGDQYRKFHSTLEFVEFIKDQNAIIYAHNGGKFDWHFILPYVDNKQKIMVINGRLSKLKIGKAELRDSINILPVPLKHINKDDFDYQKMEKETRAEHLEEIEEYLYNDCVYLHEAVISFIETYGLHLTQATASLKTWSGMGNKIPYTKKTYFDAIRPWYFGGRVTPFKKGVYNGSFDIVDINSAYPTAMMDEHPWGDEVHIKEKLKDSEIEKSFIEVECYSEGAFPLRKEDNSLDFPHQFSTYRVTGHEFKAALETGTIRRHKIKKVLTWEETINFKDYITYFYAMKLKAEREGDKQNRLFAKILMNSLYGKFAADPSKYREYYIDEYGERPPEGYASDAIVYEKQLFSKPLDDVRHKYYNVATAASITGWVRAFLWSSINKVDTPYYCDTDSIICNDKSHLPMGDELGEWALEGKASQIAIAGKKMYAARLIDSSWKTASKGVRFEPQDIVRLARGEIMTYVPEAPTFSIKNGIVFTPRTIDMKI